MTTINATYPIYDEAGCPTTIDLSKCIADLLETNIPDLPGWLQRTYLEVASNMPKASRLSKGNEVRKRALQAAMDFMDAEELQ